MLLHLTETRDYKMKSLWTHSDMDGAAVTEWSRLLVKKYLHVHINVVFNFYGRGYNLASEIREYHWVSSTSADI